jgi:hypothetical protein
VSRRTIISGVVSFDFTAAMIRERLDRDTVLGIALAGPNRKSRIGSFDCGNSMVVRVDQLLQFLKRAISIVVAHFLKIVANELFN